MNEKEVVYIVGHKNPDTDSIASAVAYADYKRQITGDDKYQAIAAGPSNAKTEALFNKFEVPFPPVKPNIYPTVKDIMSRNSSYLSEGQVLLEAVEELQKKYMYRIPVVDNGGFYKGMVSLFDVSQRIFRGVNTSGEDTSKLLSRETKTSINLAARTLDAEIIVSHDADQVESLFVFVAAMSSESFFNNIKNMSPNNLAVVVGDRANIQQMVSHLNVRLLILTGNAKIDPKIIEKAKLGKTSILRTKYDSATSVRHLKFSTPVESMLQKNVPVFKKKDKVLDIKNRVLHSQEDKFPVLNSSGKLKGTFQKSDMDQTGKVKLILVDHNNYKQAIDGAREVPLLEILDHHNLDMPTTMTPVTVYNDIVGSTCTLVAEKFKNSTVMPSKAIAGILMGGILSDTLRLKSPTCTKRDVKIVEWLENICGASIKEFERDVFMAGSSIAKLPVKRVLTEDKKSYNTDRFSLSIGQVEEFSFNQYKNKYDELLAELKVIKKEEGIDIFGLLVTNVEREDSILLIDGPQDFLFSMPYKQITENSFELPGVVSRKKQLIPKLINTIENID